MYLLEFFLRHVYKSHEIYETCDSALITFGEMRFLLISDIEFFHVINHGGITSFMDFISGFHLNTLVYFEEYSSHSLFLKYCHFAKGMSPSTFNQYSNSTLNSITISLSHTNIKLYYSTFFP